GSASGRKSDIVYQRKRSRLPYGRGSRHGEIQVRARRKNFLFLLRIVPRKISRPARPLSFTTAAFRRSGANSSQETCAASNPVIGRTVEANGAARLRLPYVPRGARDQTSSVSQVRDGPRARNRLTADDRLHVPDASGDCASGAGELSDLRHGSRTSNR